MRRHHKFTILVASIIVMCGCGDGASDNMRNENVDKLFQATVSVISSHINSMKSANDSNRIATVTQSLESKLKTLNSHFPLKTDAAFSEGQQDTIISLTDNFINLKRQKLSQLQEKDTIPSH